MFKCEVCRDHRPAGCPGCDDPNPTVILSAQEWMEDYRRELYRTEGEERDE